MRERLHRLQQFIELGLELEGTAAEFERLFTLTEGSEGQTIFLQVNGTHPPCQIAAVGVQEDGTFCFYDSRFTRMPGGICEHPLTASGLFDRLSSVRSYVAQTAIAEPATKVAA